MDSAAAGAWREAPESECAASGESGTPTQPAELPSRKEDILILPPGETMMARFDAQEANLRKQMEELNMKKHEAWEQDALGLTMKTWTRRRTTMKGEGMGRGRGEEKEEGDEQFERAPAPDPSRRNTGPSTKAPRSSWPTLSRRRRRSAVMATRWR